MHTEANWVEVSLPEIPHYITLLLANQDQTFERTWRLLLDEETNTFKIIIPNPVGDPFEYLLTLQKGAIQAGEVNGMQAEHVIVILMIFLSNLSEDFSSRNEYPGAGTGLGLTMLQSLYELVLLRDAHRTIKGIEGKEGYGEVF